MNEASAVAIVNAYILNVKQAEELDIAWAETVQYFKDGNNLSDIGKSALRKFYEADMKATIAADYLDISPTAAYGYYKRWDAE